MLILWEIGKLERCAQVAYTVEGGRVSNLQEIRGALDPAAPTVQDVGVDHGGLDAPVPQELLDRPDVVAVQQEVSCEGMP